MDEYITDEIETSIPEGLANTKLIALALYLWAVELSSPIPYSV